MKFRLFLITSALVSLALACSKTNESEVIESEFEGTLATKAINTSKGSDEGTILLYLESAPDEAFIESLKARGASSIERMLPSTPGKEDLEKRFGLDKWYVVTVDEGNTAVGVAPAFAEFDEVEAIQFNTIFEKTSDYNTVVYSGTPATKAGAVFNDPYLSVQWNYKNDGDGAIAADAYAGGDINITNVWSQLCTGDPDIIVAVVDEGVKYTHPDLAANMWVNTKEANGTSGTDDDGNGYVDDIYGYNFCDDGPITWAAEGDSGHGTHCAGVIAAVNNNGVGISSVAGGGSLGNGCKIMSCQIFSNDTGGSTAMTAKAIKYAADNGASVISCSFGYTGGAYLSDSAFRKAHSAEADIVAYFEACNNNPVLDGNIAVFAAGNNGDPYATYPGALADVISVSAYGPDFLPAYYTNYGPGCNIVAPGGEAYHIDAAKTTLVKGMILSTMPSEINDGEHYGYMQGTSMAAPHVSGIVALAMAYAKKLGRTFTVQEFKNMLMSSANDIDSRISSVGTKTLYNHSFPALSNYYHKMGTGGIDTWQLMMAIEGIPSIIVECGRKQYVDLSSYFGTASTSLTYVGEEMDDDAVGVEVDDATYAALGLQEDPYIKYGRLYIHPTKIASGKVKITVVGGGYVIGGDDEIGGMEVSQEISVVSRGFKSSNQGWL